MWIFTTHGFFSVVCARKKDGRPDKGLMMVRARTRQHLEQLRKQSKHLRGNKIVENTAVDYQFRMIVKKKAWARVVASLANDVSYPNFKDAVGGRVKPDRSYEQALHRVWEVMSFLQRKDPIYSEEDGGGV